MKRETEGSKVTKQVKYCRITILGYIMNTIYEVLPQKETKKRDQSKSKSTLSCLLTFVTREIKFSRKKRKQKVYQSARSAQSAV